MKLKIKHDIITSIRKMEISSFNVKVLNANEFWEAAYNFSIRDKINYRAVELKFSRFFEKKIS